MSQPLNQHIETIKKEFAAALSQAATPETLEKVRIDFLSRSGKIALLMGTMKDLSAEEKRIFGPLLNTLKQESHTLFDERIAEIERSLENAKLMQQKFFDVTADKKPQNRGSLHLYTHIIEHLEDIFTSMGYTIADGPEVDTDFYNFGALNIPQDHPARDMYDTFWIDVPGMLLRTHTSSVQAHVMQEQKPPMAIFVPGRCYRNEAVDASHDFMFTQAEGIFIDKKVSLANLLATAQQFLQAVFETKKLEIRVRPGFFPFVEPGVEIDASCPFCTHGCSTCKKTGWIELLGAGLVHPNVLRASGIDPEKYSGFAFGTGIERIAMIKYGIKDIRLFHSSDIRFLNQF